MAAPLGAFSQEFETLFPNISGEALFDSIASNFTTDSVLSFSQARDTLFANVFAESDSLECMYSGWKRFLDPNLDPTQAVFTNNGDNQDINTEHVYPRSRGASEGTNAHSDMHHLFPTRVPVNGSRANDPFMDIPDNVTERWYYLDQTISNPPSTNIDLWAEDINEGFEPRESSKGDAARAVFYFYTVYRDQAMSVAPTFFEAQRETLCRWSGDDPADDIELARTFKIAEYQSGIPNPFIVDCTLAERIYCQDVDNTTCVILSNDNLNIIESDWNLYPNPLKGNTISIETDREWTHLLVIDMSGRQVTEQSLSHTPSLTINLDEVTTAGTYQVILINKHDQVRSQAKMLLKE